MNIFQDSTLTSFTAPRATEFETVQFSPGTSSPRKEVSPCASCTRIVMDLPFNEGEPNPTQETRALACRLIRAFYDLSERIGTHWEEPLINSTDEGEVLLEWWSSGKHELTCYVKDDRVTALRVWGPDIYREMEQIEFSRKQWGLMLPYLWQWLHL